MRNHILFVPGNGCAAAKDYPKTWQALEHAGFSVSEVVPPWGRSFVEIAQHVTNELARQIGSSTIVLSHSHGANLALPTIRADATTAAIVASPSTLCAAGYADPRAVTFAERAFPGQADAILAYADQGRSSDRHASTGRAAVLVGEQEIATWPFMETIAEATATQLGASVTRIAEAPHFIDHHQAYIDTVVQTAQQLAHQ